MKRKTIIILTATVLAILLALCAFYVVRQNLKIAETGLKNSIPNGHGKKARVIIIGGQSNAAGWSLDEYLQKNISEEQYEKYEKGFDNVYINYFASNMNVSGKFVKCSVRQGDGNNNELFGPELGIAERLNELYPDETFFIIKWAWGATNLYDQWRSPGSSGDAGGNLYQSFLEFVNNSLKFLELKNYDIKIEAMCWMQGEADSSVEDAAFAYEKNLLSFIEDIRCELARYASDDGIAFIDAYIANSVWTYHEEINRAKKAVADSSPINTVVDTISHGLSVSEEPYGQPDLAHYDSLSELKLGYLFAEEAIKFFDE